MSDFGSKKKENHQNFAGNPFLRVRKIQKYKNLKIQKIQKNPKNPKNTKKYKKYKKIQKIQKIQKNTKNTKDTKKYKKYKKIQKNTKKSKKSKNYEKALKMESSSLTIFSPVFCQTKDSCGCSIPFPLILKLDSKDDICSKLMTNTAVVYLIQFST